MKTRIKTEDVLVFCFLSPLYIRCPIDESIGDGNADCFMIKDGESAVKSIGELIDMVHSHIREEHPDEADKIPEVIFNYS